MAQITQYISPLALEKTFRERIGIGKTRSRAAAAPPAVEKEEQNRMSIFETGDHITYLTFPGANINGDRKCKTETVTIENAFYAKTTSTIALFNQIKFVQMNELKSYGNVLLSAAAYYVEAKKAVPIQVAAALGRTLDEMHEYTVLTVDNKYELVIQKVYKNVTIGKFLANSIELGEELMEILFNFNEYEETRYKERVNEDSSIERGKYVFTAKFPDARAEE